MKSKFVYLTVLSVFLAAQFSFGKPAHGNAKPIYAQKLVDELIERNADMLDVVFHVTPEGQAKNVVIASHLAKSKAEGTGDDDLGVIKTGQPLVEVQKDGKRIGTVIQLKDHDGKVIGALGLIYSYTPGEDQQKVLARSNSIRDQLAKQINRIGDLTAER